MENDFGFTTHNEDELLQKTKFSEDDYKNRLKKIEKLILPLIENLIKTSDNEIIKWPNRKEPLQKLLAEIKELTK